MKTYQPKAKEIKRNWHLVDASDEVLGRLASYVAVFLMGKHKATYATHLDSGDYVVVVNADKVRLTGKKAKQKVYRKHSGYPGGFKEIKFEKLASENPKKVIELAIGGMLPDNRLKAGRMARLKVLVGERNPYDDKVKRQEGEKVK